ncbi:MAG: AAA family ATPase [Planctomycetes bacterium]|nr:AAA family ATPase [Planctomycetota bacterium]
MREPLLRYLQRERLAERRYERELRALSLAERVECGEALAGLSVVSQGGGRITVAMSEHSAKFREGDVLWLGDGVRIEEGLPVRLVRYDGAARQLHLELDGREEASPLRAGRELVLDRRSMDLAERFALAVEDVYTKTNHPIALCLEGKLSTDDDEAVRREAEIDGFRRGLDRTQAAAFARAFARPKLHMIQGPPGTGKTRLLAEILSACAERRERVAVVAYTHRAVDQVLVRAAQRTDPRLVWKLDSSRSEAPELAAAGVRRTTSAERGASTGPAIVGLTTHAACRAADRATFDRVVFDEAGQIPLPHAVGAMRLGPRWLFVGDHAQLPPVVAGEHAEEWRASIFAHLVERYPSTMLETTYRMNSGICDFPSRAFYAGNLKPSAEASSRRLALAPGGRFRDVLDPQRPAVLVEVPHRGAAMRSRREAAIVAELSIELMAHHRLPAEELAVIAPFRAQGMAIREELERRAAIRGFRPASWPLVETVERIQGREREVVLISLASSDPEWLAEQTDFYFSPNRLNVALTRARTKRILVASPLAFRVRARTLEDVPALSVFAALYRETPRIDGASVEKEIEVDG